MCLRASFSCINSSLEFSHNVMRWSGVWRCCKFFMMPIRIHIEYSDAISVCGFRIFRLIRTWFDSTIPTICRNIFAVALHSMRAMCEAHVKHSIIGIRCWSHVVNYIYLRCLYIAPMVSLFVISIYPVIFPHSLQTAHGVCSVREVPPPLSQLCRDAVASAIYQSL